MSIALNIFATSLSILLVGAIIGLSCLIVISMKSNGSKPSGDNYNDSRDSFLNGLIPSFSKKHQSEKNLKIHIFRFQNGGEKDAGAKLTIAFSNLARKSKLANHCQILFDDTPLKYHGVEATEKVIKAHLQQNDVDLGMWGYLDAKKETLKIRFVLAHGAPIELALLYQHGTNYEMPIMAHKEELQSILTSLAHLAALNAHQNFEIAPRKGLKKLRSSHAELIKNLRAAKKPKPASVRIRLLQDYAFSSLVAHQIWGENDDISQSITAYRGLLAEQDQHVSRKSKNSVRVGLGNSLLNRGMQNNNIADLKNAAISLKGAAEFIDKNNDMGAWLSSSYSLASSLSELGEITNDHNALIESEQILNEVSVHYNPVQNPEDYLKIQVKLAEIQHRNAALMGDHPPFDALNTLRNSSKINRDAVSPRLLNQADKDLGHTLLKIGKFEDDLDYMQAGIKALDFALSSMPSHAVQARHGQQAQMNQVMEKLNLIQDEISIFKTELGSEGRQASKVQEPVSEAVDTNDLDNDSFVDLFSDGDVFVQDRRSQMQRRKDRRNDHLARRAENITEEAVAAKKHFQRKQVETNNMQGLNADMIEKITRRKEERRKRREAAMANQSKNGAPIRSHPTMYNPVSPLKK